MRKAKRKPAATTFSCVQSIRQKGKVADYSDDARVTARAGIRAWTLIP